MTTSITFTIPGVPVAWARARRNGNRYFNDAKTADYAEAVRWAAQEEMGGEEVMEGPVAVRMSFGFPVPKSWSKKLKAAALNGIRTPAVKPDLDNLTKLILDAIQADKKRAPYGVVFIDDKQVVEVFATKRYSTRPGVTVTVRAL